MSQSPAVVSALPDSEQHGTRLSDAASLVDFYGLIEIVLKDPALSPEQKKMLIDEVRKSTPASDRWTYRYAIYALAIVVVIALVGALLTSSNGNAPEGVIAIGSAAVGGLAGLLSPGRRG